MKLLLYCLLAMLWPVGHTYAQTSVPKIRPLTVGDTLPPDLVLENVVNQPTSQIPLSNLKGKLIILDFWGKYCGPCILALNKLDSLQQANNEILQVITISDFEDQAELFKSLQRFKQTQNLTLPVVLGNNQLINYFPYNLVSHLVWINENGVIKAITGAEYITHQNVEDFITGRAIDWPVKKDVLEFDHTRPLLEYAQAEESRPTSIFYSTFTSHMDGIAPPNGVSNDKVRNTSIVAFYNFSLLSLSQLAADYKVGAKRSQFVLQVSDTLRFIKPNDELASQWKKRNTYCYYLLLPDDIPKSKIPALVKEDITKWLRIMGFEVRKVRKKQNGVLSTFYIIKEVSVSSGL